VLEAVAPPRNATDRYRDIRPTVAVRFYLDGDLRWQRTRGARKFWQKGENLDRPVVVASTIGLTAIAAGRDRIVIDRYALADPLLARLPPRGFLMAGHFARIVPAGYRHARRTGDLGLLDPMLAAYYRPLREIISGPLLSGHRLAEIVKFNLGFYDEHLDAYVARRSEAKDGGSLQRSPHEDRDE